MYIEMAEVYKKMEEMRKENSEFDNFVTQVESKIEQVIFSQKNLTRITRCKIDIKVKAIPITKQQKKYLTEYIYNRYIKFVDGDFFTVERCWFSKKYRIRSYDFCDTGICIS